MSPVDIPMPWPEQSVEARVTQRAQGLSRSPQSATDPDGRSLRSLFIAGRTNEPLSDDDVKDLSRVLTDRPYVGIRPSGADAAIVATTAPRGGEIKYTPPDHDMRYANEERAHELGHLVDFRSNLLTRYNDLQEDDQRALIARQLTAAAHHYARSRDGADGDGNLREQFADAIAYYLRNGDEFKQQAPDLAQFIRGVVNEDPMMKGILTFAQADNNRGIG